MFLNLSHLLWKNSIRLLEDLNWNFKRYTFILLFTNLKLGMKCFNERVSGRFIAHNTFSIHFIIKYSSWSCLWKEVYQNYRQFCDHEDTIRAEYSVKKPILGPVNNFFLLSHTGIKSTGFRVNVSLLTIQLYTVFFPD